MNTDENGVLTQEEIIKIGTNNGTSFSLTVEEVREQARQELIKEIEDNAGETLFLLEDLPFWQSLKQPNDK